MRTVPDAYDEQLVANAHPAFVVLLAVRTARAADNVAAAPAMKAWLFVGSDDHAQATANLISLMASCKLHGLDPEAYLRDLIRVLVHWPSDATSSWPLGIGLPPAPGSIPGSWICPSVT